jgi:hypothetical protein
VDSVTGGSFHFYVIDRQLVRKGSSPFTNSQAQFLSNSTYAYTKNDSVLPVPYIKPLLDQTECNTHCLASTGLISVIDWSTQSQHEHKEVQYIPHCEQPAILRLCYSTGRTIHVT